MEMKGQEKAKEIHEHWKSLEVANSKSTLKWQTYRDMQGGTAQGWVLQREAQILSRSQEKNNKDLLNVEAQLIKILSF